MILDKNLLSLRGDPVHHRAAPKVIWLAPQAANRKLQIANLFLCLSIARAFA
jgi:hypothetical protein